MKRVWHSIAARPFLASLTVLLLVAVPGYLRLDYAVDEAHDAARDSQEATDKLEDVVARLDAEIARNEQDRAARRHELCLRDIDDRADVRIMWLEAFDLFPSSPEVAQLRVTLDTRLPILECNAEDVPVPVDG